MIGKVSGNFHTKKPRGRSEISKFKMTFQLFDSGINFSFGIGGQGNIINEDRDDDQDAFLGIDINASVRFQPLASQSDESRMQLLIPLLKAI